MNVERITVDRAKARELYREYKKHQFYSKPIDEEIQRTYKALSQGRMVILALESIRVAGLNDQWMPKLAICRADKETCECSLWRDGACRMESQGWHRGARGQRFSWPPGSFSARQQAVWRAATRVPLIPVHLRPKRGLANYHVLWEAEWRPLPPHDPMLLRRLGGDLWLVVAAWDLTPVERAAMATRMTS